MVSGSVILQRTKQVFSYSSEGGCSLLFAGANCGYDFQCYDCSKKQLSDHCSHHSSLPTTFSINIWTSEYLSAAAQLVPEESEKVLSKWASFEALELYIWPPAQNKPCLALWGVCEHHLKLQSRTRVLCHSQLSGGHYQKECLWKDSLNIVLKYKRGKIGKNVGTVLWHQISYKIFLFYIFTIIPNLLTKVSWKSLQISSW